MKRAAIAIALTVFLLAAGVTGASAVWTVSTGFTASAHAAQTGITQTGSLDALGFTYDPAEAAYATADVVTVANTGTRSADYVVTATASGASVTGLPAAIHVVIGVVATPAACTPSAALDPAQAGTLSEPFTYDSSMASEQVPADGFVTLCVQTSIDEGDAERFGATSLEVTLQTGLRYAAGAAWSVAAPAITLVQEVASTLLFFDDPAGRYLLAVRDAAGTPECVYRTSISGTQYPVRGSACTDWQNQWRLTEAADNEWYIAEAVNSTSQSDEQRWQSMGAGASVRLATASTSAAQRWTVRGRGDGSYSIHNVADGLCAATSDAQAWNGGPALLTSATCDPDDERQAFAFEPVSAPVPEEPLATTCGGSLPWHLTLGWPVNEGYEAEADYRILFDEVQYATQDNGYSTSLGIGNKDAALKAFVDQHGVGIKQVTVQQSISGSPWATYAVGSIEVFYQNGNTLGLGCP